MRLILVPTVAQGPADSCASPIQLPAPSEAPSETLLIFSERDADILGIGLLRYVLFYCGSFAMPTKRKKNLYVEHM